MFDLSLAARDRSCSLRTYSTTGSVLLKNKKLWTEVTSVSGKLRADLRCQTTDTCCEAAGGRNRVWTSTLFHLKLRDIWFVQKHWTDKDNTLCENGKCVFV